MMTSAESEIAESDMVAPTEAEIEAACDKMNATPHGEIDFDGLFRVGFIGFTGASQINGSFVSIEEAVAFFSGVAKTLQATTGNGLPVYLVREDDLPARFYMRDLESLVREAPGFFDL